MNMAGLSPIVSMLHSTCRERYLRKLDPLVPDETLIFLCDGTRNTTTREMKEVNGLAPLKVPTGVADAHVMGYEGAFGLCASTGTALVPSLLTRHVDWTDSGELYLRVVGWFPRYMGPAWAKSSYPLVVLRDTTTGEIILKLDAVWNGNDNPRSYIARLSYMDSTGVRYTSTIGPGDKDWETNWADIRVFIPAGSPALFSYTQYFSQELIDSKVGSLGSGFWETDSMELSILSDDGETPTGNSARVNRVGMGASVTTPIIFPSA